MRFMGAKASICDGAATSYVARLPLRSSPRATAALRQRRTAPKLQQLWKVVEAVIGDQLQPHGAETAECYPGRYCRRQSAARCLAILPSEHHNAQKSAPKLRIQMAKNKTAGDHHREGAVKTRSQVKSPLTGTRTKRDDRSGKFIDVKSDSFRFKGVRKVSSKELSESSDRFSKAMKRLAKR
jgi:hypothetical protein